MHSNKIGQNCMNADGHQAGEQLEQRSRSVESLEGRHMLRHQSPARISADATAFVRNSPRLKVSKVMCVTGINALCKQ